MSREKPAIIQEVGFDFSWDEKKVWALDIPVETMAISELTWHFDVPFLWSNPEGFYDVTPREVMKGPGQHPEEYARMLQADTSYPLDVMFYKKRWLLLDGLHRLMKLATDNREEVSVRKIPETAIPLIQT